jgi:hypothetical protein
MAGDQCADVVWRGRGGSRDHRPRTRLRDWCGTGVVLVAIGLGISFLATEQWGLLGTATTIIGALLLASGVGVARVGWKFTLLQVKQL